MTGSESRIKLLILYITEVSPRPYGRRTKAMKERSIMSDYHISRILESDKREIKKLEVLLQNEGIERDKNLDYMAGLYDDDYNLVAAGSCFKNTLRCLAVDSAHQGEGLLNQVVSHLIDYEYQRGILNLFLYTKCDKALFFLDLGFYEVARVEGKVVFMENRKSGFSSYLENLKNETAVQTQGKSWADITPGTVGAVIMNANPFTLGHQYLLETSAAACDLLHVFVVSEDVSLVPFSVRYDLVVRGAEHLHNIVFHKTGDYMISSATFPSYFLKDEHTVIRSHAGLDIAVFEQLAKVLEITIRFVGEEPFSQVTGIYNQVMEEKLQSAGIECRVIPRKTDGNSENVISASTVRKMIQQGDIENVRELVPDSTYQYFTSEKATAVIEKIRGQADVVHY